MANGPGKDAALDEAPGAAEAGDGRSRGAPALGRAARPDWARVNGGEALDSAVLRLDAALSRLDRAVRTRIEGERSRRTIERELAALRDDRARLAADLDGALARARALDAAALAAGERVIEAIGGIDALLLRGDADGNDASEPNERDAAPDASGAANRPDRGEP